MDILKKYSAMLIPLAIVLVAGGLIVATLLLSGSLKQSMAASAAQHRELQNLMNSAVSLEQVEVEKQVQDAHQQEADAVEEFGLGAGRRELLSYVILPEPSEGEHASSIFFDYADEYVQSIESQLERINAGQPPSASELALAVPGSSSGRSGAALSAEQARIRDSICRQRAQSISVYAGPLSLAGYDFWADFTYQGRRNGIIDAWFWQLGYWIQQDVIDTILAANAGSSNVLDAPVKRLIAVGFNTTDAASIRRVRSTARGTDTRAASRAVGDVGRARGTTVAVAATSPEAPFFTTESMFLSPPWTGRMTNDELDVIQFSFAVVVRARDVLPFIAELGSQKEHVFRGFDGNGEPRRLSRNQITVLSMTAAPVDLAAHEAEGYRYGDDAVYTLNFVCEYIFDNSSYDEIKPELLTAQAADPYGY